MSVRSRRFALPLLVVGFLFIGTCTHHDRLLPENTCAGGGTGHDRRELPVMCVDNTGGTLSVHPNRIVAWDKRQSAPGATNMLHWTTRTKPANLQLRFRQEGCVETPVCDGKGHCRAEAIPVAGENDVRRCKYDVIVDGRVLDPDAIIIRCCSNEEPPPEP